MCFIVMHKTILRPLSKIFERIVIIRRHFYKGRLTTIADVISVGNIALGGTGKTELVAILAQRLLTAQRKVFILTRGYKGSVKSGVVDTENPAAFGDEPAMLFNRFKDNLVIFKSRKKFKGLAQILNSVKTERNKPVIVVDDGFQHLKLARKEDYVCINALNAFGNGYILPYGILREPINHLKYADKIVLVNSRLIHPNRRADLINRLKIFNKELLFMDYFFVGFKDINFKNEDVNKDGKLFVFAGIGNPLGLLRLLRYEKYKIAGHIFFRDHFRYRKKDISYILNRADECNADTLVTTEKDIVKLKNFPVEKNIVFLKIKTELRKYV